MPLTVFMSHSMKNVDIVNTLYSYLKQSGINVITAQSFNPSLRMSFHDQVMEMIKKADCVLAFLTQSDKDSYSVHQEIGMARAFGKLVVLIVEKGVILPDSLRAFGYILYDRDNPWETVQNISQYALFLKTSKEQEERKKSLGMGLAALFFALLMFAAFAEKG